jgi:iron complex transport system permease protein
MAGSILLITADLAGRTLFSPTEVPVGIFTALLGVPFFLTLLLRRKSHV